MLLYPYHSLLLFLLLSFIILDIHGIFTLFSRLCTILPKPERDEAEQGRYDSQYGTRNIAAQIREHLPAKYGKRSRQTGTQKR